MISNHYCGRHGSDYCMRLRTAQRRCEAFAHLKDCDTCVAPLLTAALRLVCSYTAHEGVASLDAIDSEQTRLRQHFSLPPVAGAGN